MNKYTSILRWLSLMPVAFTTFMLSDWLVRVLFWFIELPIVIFEKIGFSSGPIGKFMDIVTNYLIGLDSHETVVITATGLLTGYAMVYIPTIIAPANNKKTTKTLAITYLILLALGLTAVIVNGITGENILWTILLTVGVLLAWQSVENETAQETAIRYEKFVQKNIVPIFISTLAFTILLAGLFLI